MGWIPRRVEDDDPVGCDQVDAQTAGLGGDEEETHLMIRGLKGKGTFQNPKFKKLVSTPTLLK